MDGDLSSIAGASAAGARTRGAVAASRTKTMEDVDEESEILNEKSTKKCKTRKTRSDFGIELNMVKLFVKNSLFPRCKFMDEDDNLEYSEEPGSICQQCLAYCWKLNDDPPAFWKKARLWIPNELNMRRNKVQSTMKDEFMSE